MLHTHNFYRPHQIENKNPGSAMAVGHCGSYGPVFPETSGHGGQRLLVLYPYLVIIPHSLDLSSEDIDYWSSFDI